MKLFLILSTAVTLVVAAPTFNVNNEKNNSENTMNLSAPLVDLSKSPAVLPQEIPIHEQPQELTGANSNVAKTLSVSDAEWQDYKTKYGKLYDDPVEDMTRRKLFAESLAFVQEHNKKYEAGEVTFSVGINKFADRKPEEKPQSGFIRRSKTEQ